jgi:hypothetical protein
MFRVDRSTNRITKLQEVRFSDLGLSERNHLQEWLANQPDALGEELLIIQKEFAGFDDTKERLDLLALDKGGNLVIIENKLDDSGRNVVWQSLKYASYCSTLSKTSIVKMYQQFLDREGVTASAQERICQFLDQEDFGEVALNAGTEQRLVMVAAQFRKEVTSTVLWLLKHDVKVECFKATPFKLGDQIILNLEQIIPLPEAEELMIGIAEKEKEEHATERGQAVRHILRREFWQKTLEALEAANVGLYENVRPSKDNWLHAGAGIGGVHYSMVFLRQGARMELVLNRGTKETNKAMFDLLLERRADIEKAFGSPLEWHRFDEYNLSVIGCTEPFEGHDKASWPTMVEWFVETVPRLHRAFSPHISALRQLLKTQFPKANGRAGPGTEN